MSRNLDNLQWDVFVTPGIPIVTRDKRLYLAEVKMRRHDGMDRRAG
jgi:hypothetical protein